MEKSTLFFIILFLFYFIEAFPLNFRCESVEDEQCETVQEEDCQDVEVKNSLVIFMFILDGQFI